MAVPLLLMEAIPRLLPLRLPEVVAEGQLLEPPDLPEDLVEEARDRVLYPDLPEILQPLVLHRVMMEETGSLLVRQLVVLEVAEVAQVKREQMVS